MITSSKPVQFIDHQPNLNEAPFTSRGDVIDFFEARDRLLAEFCEPVQTSAALRDICDDATRRRRSIELTNRFELSFYWLISLPALAYLALNII
jgi:hypothetical protein